MLLIVPSVIFGVPLGIALLRRVEAETFRRVCMSFDAWVVGFGLSRTLIELGVLASPQAYGVLAATFIIDGWLLFRYFGKARKTPSLVLAPSNPSTAEYVPNPSVNTEKGENLSLPLIPFPRSPISPSS
jgi:hypothetical protein